MKTLNNNIQESYCSFEVSKLLRENGFNVQFDDPQDGYVTMEHISHALAIEWIRVNFEYYIYVFRYQGKWQWKVDGEHGICDFSRGEGFNSSQEATEAALLYVLKNLM